MHPAVAERLARLAPDQRAAATAPPGPILCVAPAGSGKTTTLVARMAWLIDGDNETVYIYRSGVEKPEKRTGIVSLAGEGPVAGFVLDLKAIWAGL